MTRIIVTGNAGFIGFHLTKRLLDDGHEVLGIDGMTDYYDLQLKLDRLQQLEDYTNFRHVTSMLEDLASIQTELADFDPDIIVHLAAQAGVRYSIENPDAYISSNVHGTLRVLELARATKARHLMIASTSSAYGGNIKMPFSESDTTRSPVSLYAATKLSSEALAHSFSHLWKIPTTCFRFFTVSGPWGRPDMALFKFVDAIEEGRPIDVYGFGKMRRDFTYIDDLVESVRNLMDAVPEQAQQRSEHDTVSPIAPYRIVNIAGGSPTELMEFVDAVEQAMNAKAEINLMPMQPGDVVATWAEPALLRDLIGSTPETSVVDGVRHFVDWHREYFAQRRRAEQVVSA